MMLHHFASATIKNQWIVYHFKLREHGLTNLATFSSQDGFKGSNPSIPGIYSASFFLNVIVEDVHDLDYSSYNECRNQKKRRTE